jgi:hypothetical protein
MSIGPPQLAHAYKGHAGRIEYSAGMVEELLAGNKKQPPG